MKRFHKGDYFMQITSDKFGQVDGQDIERYTITNRSGSLIRVLTYGAVWQGFVVDGKDVIVHFDDVDHYAGSANYGLCKTVGPVAGRITNATAVIHETAVHFDANENGNTLHGGPHGFANLIWEVADKTVNAHDASVTLQRHIPSTEDHFPGDVDAQVTFKFNDDNEVSITFGASTTEATLFNPTNHVYFNLTDGQKDLTKQQLQINGTQRLELDEEKLPTGKFLDLVGTGYDFIKPTHVTDALDKIEKETGKTEIDDAFKVTPSGTDPIAIVSADDNKRRVEIYSDRNGLVVYTANPLDDSKPYNALATEAQMLPDAVNHAGFGDIILEPGKPKEYTITYKFFEG